MSNKNKNNMTFRENNNEIEETKIDTSSSETPVEEKVTEEKQEEPKVAEEPAKPTIVTSNDSEINKLQKELSELQKRLDNTHYEIEKAEIVDEMIKIERKIKSLNSASLSKEGKSSSKNSKVEIIDRRNSYRVNV